MLSTVLVRLIIIHITSSFTPFTTILNNRYTVSFNPAHNDHNKNRCSNLKDEVTLLSHPRHGDAATSTSTESTTRVENNQEIVMKYEQVTTRSRLLDLRVFRGFSMSALEYMTLHQEKNVSNQEESLSFEEAIQHLTLSYDDYGRDKKLLEFYEKKKNHGISGYDHVVHFVAIVNDTPEEHDDNDDNDSSIYRTNGVVASVDAQIKRDKQQEDVYVESTEYVSLKNLKVHPNHRRKGIASTLVQMVKTYTLEMGLSSIVLEVNPLNHGAIYLYEKEGFISIEDDFENHGKMVLHLH